MGVDRTRTGGHIHGLHRPGAPVAATVDDGACRRRSARVRLLARVNAPGVACVADLRRRHIEDYKLHLAARPSARGGTLTKTSLAEHLGGLRTCLAPPQMEGSAEKVRHDAPDDALLPGRCPHTVGEVGVAPKSAK